MFEQFHKTIEEIADKTAEMVLSLFREKLRKFQPNYQLLYSEKEAAEFLKISLDTLQRWRKAGLIDYTEYPSLAELKANNKRFNLKYVYKLENLLELVERFQVRHPTSKKYNLAKEQNLLPVNYGHQER